MSKSTNVRRPSANSITNVVKSPPPPTQTSNLVFDEMNSENRTYHSKSHHYHPQKVQTNSDDISTFGLLKRGLRIANLNICHILNKVDEIKILLSEKRSVDILGICETFLNSEVPNELITVDGFNFERKDREGKSGGGILVYLSQSLNYKRRTDLEGEIETIWLEISLPNSKPILYCSAYRPPSAPVAWIDLLTKQIEHASCSDNEIIISGDMNINIMQDPQSTGQMPWRCLISRKLSPVQHVLLKIPAR